MENIKTIGSQDKTVGIGQTALETALVVGDLSRLTITERLAYYKKICDSLGLNPLTRPLEYIHLNGRLVLYARKDCTEQLRKIHGISVNSLSSEMISGVYVVTASVSDASGRTDTAKGAVSIQDLTGDALANGIMKAETKSKRRATLSICGLGILDESELESCSPGLAAATTIRQPERLSEKHSEKLAAFKQEDAPSNGSPAADKASDTRHQFAENTLDFSKASIQSFSKDKTFQYGVVKIGDEIFKVFEKKVLDAAARARDARIAAEVVYKADGLDLILIDIKPALI